MRNIPNLEILGPPSILPESLQQLQALGWYEKRESYDFTGPSRMLRDTRFCIHLVHVRVQLRL